MPGGHQHGPRRDLLRVELGEHQRVQVMLSAEERARGRNLTNAQAGGTCVGTDGAQGDASEPRGKCMAVRAELER